MIVRIHRIEAGKQVGMDTILYVEDNKTNAFVVEMALRRDYDVVVAYSPEEAMECLASGEFLLILMDINLGENEMGMDGVQLAKHIWGSPQWSTIPIIAVTAYTLPEHEQAFRQAGFCDFVPKPIKLDRLMGAIQKALH